MCDRYVSKDHVPCDLGNYRGGGGGGGYYQSGDRERERDRSYGGRGGGGDQWDRGPRRDRGDKPRGGFEEFREADPGRCGR